MTDEVRVERRRRDDAALDALLQTVTAMANSLTEVQQQQKSLTERFEKVEAVTDSIHTVSKVFNGIERTAVWITKIAAVVAIAGAAWKYGISQIAESLGIGGKTS